MFCCYSYFLPLLHFFNQFHCYFCQNLPNFLSKPSCEPGLRSFLDSEISVQSTLVLEINFTPFSCNNIKPYSIWGDCHTFSVLNCTAYLCYQHFPMFTLVSKCRHIKLTCVSSTANQSIGTLSQIMTTL